MFEWVGRHPILWILLHLPKGVWTLVWSSEGESPRETSNEIRMSQTSMSERAEAAERESLPRRRWEYGSEPERSGRGPRETSE